MNHIRQTISTGITALGASILAAASAALALEAIYPERPRTYRPKVADLIQSVLATNRPYWQATLLGLALAFCAIAIVSFEFARPPKGTRIMHNVHHTEIGNTQISGKATIRAVERACQSVEGVVDITCTITTKTANVIARVDDRCNLTSLDDSIRTRLDHGFWIDLGLADFAVNLTVTHHPKPPRVR